MYRFALQARWIASHVFAIVMVVLFANLGFWQLRRHDERVARNEQVLERGDLPSVDVRDLLAEGLDDPEEYRFRPVSASGEYLSDRSCSSTTGRWTDCPARGSSQPCASTTVRSSR